MKWYSVEKLELLPLKLELLPLRTLNGGTLTKNEPLKSNNRDGAQLVLNHLNHLNNNVRRSHV